MSENVVYLRMTQGAWDTLRETLEMDTKSIAIDRSLRRDIAAALEQVQTLATIEPEPDFLDEICEVALQQNIVVTDWIQPTDVKLVSKASLTEEQMKDVLRNCSNHLGTFDDAVIDNSAKRDFIRAHIDNVLED